MNRQERRAKGIKGKKGDAVITGEAIKIARDLTAVHKYDEAKDLYLKILKFDPENEIALLDLGIACVRDNFIGEAENLVKKTLILNDKNCPALTVMAVIRMAQSNVRDALRLMEKALKLNPSPQVLNRLGVLFMDAGQLDRATQYLEMSVQQKPDYIEGYYHLKQLRKFTQSDIDKMLAIEGQRQLTLDDKIRLEFALGNAGMDIGAADIAFRHLNEGNMLKRATYKYSAANFEKYIDNVISLFNEDVIAKLRGRAPVDKNIPIFIVGLPRSGSTLVDQIISSHPDVSSMGESKTLIGSVPVYLNEEVPDFFGPSSPSFTKKMIADLSPQMLDTIVAKYRRVTDPFAKNATYVIDKMLFNFLWIGLLRLAFPESKIVHSMRDPVDMGLSIYRLLFTDDIPWSYNLEEIGSYTKAYRKLMAHWHKLFPGEIYDLSYEAMVADQAGESRKLLDFCGLSWNDRVLNFHETERSVQTASSAQVRQPIYKDSVKKWKKYEKQLKPLIDALGVVE